MQIGKATMFAVLALAAGILLVPDATLARGAGFARHGPVFGFHPRAGHPFRPAAVGRAPVRLGWQLRWWRARHGAGAVVYPAGDGVAPPDADVTGSVPVPGPAVFLPPLVPPPPAERGCFARGYEVPGEAGGGAYVTVIRC